ncbi:MAG: hypothetical protein KA004_06070 [Verrucomicrobiales bacterium]|nr:hypothetical protein [Verrucomicrobiales bacterium]
MRAAIIFLCCLTSLACGQADSAPTLKVVHVFVALADNATQGIVPVPKKIGDGDNPATNLYWGCDEGMKGWFSKTRAWKRIAVLKEPDKTGEAEAVILERLIFRHAEKSAVLVADAYRGSQIRRCMEDFLASAGGRHPVTLHLDGKEIPAGGAAQMILYAGHNGLLDFSLKPEDPVKNNPPRSAAAFCCVSDKTLGPLLVRQGATPLLLTTQLMYPGAFLIEATANGWLAGETPAQLHQRAAAAYAANQNISHKAAAGVFTTAVPIR